MHSLTIMSSAADCDTRTYTPMQESSYTSASNVQESSNTVYAPVKNEITSTPVQGSSYTTVNNEITSTPVEESGYITDNNKITPVEESSNPVTNKISDTCHSTCNPVQESSGHTTVNNKITCTPVEESSYMHDHSEMICIMVIPWDDYHRPQESYNTN